MSITIIILLYYILLNLWTFNAFRRDKEKARRDQWRTSEFALLFPAFLGGGLGAFLGMRVFHHKTMKWKFRILVPLFILLHIFIIASILLFKKGYIG
jgi:uncharacterized membrane protein YsdA (DUF1294 family)